MKDKTTVVARIRSSSSSMFGTRFLIKGQTTRENNTGIRERDIELSLSKSEARALFYQLRRWLSEA